MAARYRKIDPPIWTDEKFRQLKGGDFCANHPREMKFCANGFL